MHKVVVSTTLLIAFSHVGSMNLLKVKSYANLVNIEASVLNTTVSYL